MSYEYSYLMFFVCGKMFFNCFKYSSPSVNNEIRVSQSKRPKVIFETNQRTGICLEIIFWMEYEFLISNLSMFFMN